MKPTTLKTAFLTTRPAFLLLTPICIFLGLSISLGQQVDISITIALLIIIGAMCAHISVNMLNEYYDFKSGLDLDTDKTAFSGGSGALPNHPEAANVVLSIGIVSLCITILIGFYFIAVRGSQILPIGLIGALLVVTYTQWVNRLPLLCLIAPGLGFGVLMVVGTHTVIAGAPSSLAWLISLIPFFLINNLLLLNQYPDIQADANNGRRTFPIVYGVRASNMVYAIFLISCFGLMIASIVNGTLPRLSVIAICPIILALYALSGAIKHADQIGRHPQYLAANVATALLTPLLLAIAITYGQ